MEKEFKDSDIEVVWRVEYTLKEPHSVLSGHLHISDYSQGEHDQAKCFFYDLKGNPSIESAIFTMVTIAKIENYSEPIQPSN